MLLREKSEIPIFLEEQTKNELSKAEKDFIKQIDTTAKRLKK